MRYFRVAEFARLQHYKSQNEAAPRWIKLYRDLLHDYQFLQLPDAAKAHLVMIQLLYSQSQKPLPCDPRWLAARIGAQSPIDLDRLLAGGWLVLEPEGVVPLERPALFALERKPKCGSYIYSSSDHDLDPDQKGESEGVRALEPKRKRRAETPWPSDHALSAVMAEYATARGIEPVAEFARWRDDCLAHDRRYRDWDAAWRTRIANAVLWGRSAVAVRPAASVSQQPLRLTPANEHLMRRIAAFKQEEQNRGQKSGSGSAADVQGGLAGPADGRPDPKPVV